MYPWGRLSVSVSCFVPKPWTPFQWTVMEDEKRLAEKLRLIKQALRGVRRVEVASESAREAVAQGVLARGSRRVKDALLAVSREGVSWRAAFKKSGIDPRFYAQRERGADEVFPWDHLDLGIEKNILRQQYDLALKENP
jgi:predicted Fe-S protein YdhL (DUF1289 family)